jgi:xanthine dehydrogenase large subunit
LRRSSFHSGPFRINAATRLGHLSSPHRLTGELAIGGQEHFYLETHVRHRALDEPAASSSIPQRSIPPKRRRLWRACWVSAQSGHGAMPAHGRRVRRQGSAGESVGRDRRARHMEDETPGARAPAARVSIWRSPASAIRSSRASQWASKTMAGCAASDLKLYSDGGWSLDLSDPVLWRALFHCDNAYLIPGARRVGLRLQNAQDFADGVPRLRRPAGHDRHRRHSRPHRAHAGLCPDEVRERNFYREGDARITASQVKDASRIDASGTS